MKYRTSDFGNLSWHDCHIWGIQLRIGDPEQNDWTSDLDLDIDFILEWICGTDGQCQFRVAPANLVFHDVTDLSITIDWGRSGFQVSIHPVSIEAIERSLIDEQKICLDRPYYRWSIKLNWPEGGLLQFGATGFTQSLRAAPILRQQQHYPRTSSPVDR